ncbi:MAG: DUF3300 domain-containing protein [Holophaga sp.]|jgi:hypothetical protein
MNMFGQVTTVPSARSPLVPALLLAAVLGISAAGSAQGEPPAPPPPPASAPPPAYAQQSAAQLQQLVAPIALYPDPLVGQILAAATFPEQVVEADRWLQEHPDLKGDALAQAVSRQPWDPSVQALTAFPAVLGNMDKNLAWTSSLGDAYFNQQQAVMDAVQAMRHRAMTAGTLQSTLQETVGVQGSSVSIEPPGGEDVYLPAYDPWTAYGDPIAPWPDWYSYPGIWSDGPYLSFAIVCPIAFLAPYPWGWYGWRLDWRNRWVVYNHERFVSRSRTFYNRSAYFRQAGGPGGERPRAGGSRPVAPGRREYRAEGHGNAYDHRGEPVRPFEGNTRAARGYAEPQERAKAEPNAFGGYQHGGQERGFSARGGSSMGGGGGGPARRRF